MSRLDHHEFELAIFKGSRRKSVACHLFDDRPICEKVLLRLYLRWQPGLQNAALPRVPVRYLKRYRLRSLADFLFGGLGKLLHTLFLYDNIALVANEVGRISGEIGRGSVGWISTPGTDLIDAGRSSRDPFDLRQALRPLVRAGLRVADGLGQHLT
jgi:hypothetical protein